MMSTNNSKICKHKSPSRIEFVTEGPLTNSYWMAICLDCKEPVFEYRGRTYDLQQFNDLIERSNNNSK